MGTSKSNDSQDILAIARNERLPSDAKQIIKDPMCLEFLGLTQEPSYYEKELEKSIITHLQEFLLELGNGFSFVARQRRLHIDGDEFFIDLVFYNRLLRCFVILEILCCAPHNRSYVAKSVMWCQPLYPARISA